MKVLVAEYAVGSSSTDDKKDASLLIEGKAMLETLKRSFENIGKEVVYPVGEKDFEGAIEKLSKKSDAAIVISPDEMLFELTKIVESNTVNLGCSSHSVKICADKKKTTEILTEAGIMMPKIMEEHEIEKEKKKENDGEYVVKRRYGCASEDVFITKNFLSLKRKYSKERFIVTEFIRGEDISSSVVVSSISILPLTINKQFIKKEGKQLRYGGGLVPYFVGAEIQERVMDISKKVVTLLHCAGYVGIDFILGNNGMLYVVEVNPRPTTSIVGIAKVLNYEIAELILNAKYGNLPKKAEIGLKGSFTFYK